MKKQLGQLKDRELESRLSNLSRDNNHKDNYYNNNNINFGTRSTDSLLRLPPPLRSPGAPNEPFDPFAGAAAPLTSLPRGDLQCHHILVRYLHHQIMMLCLQKELPWSIHIRIFAEFLPGDQLLALYLASAKESCLCQNYLQKIKLGYRQLLGEHFPN